MIENYIDFLMFSSYPTLKDTDQFIIYVESFLILFLFTIWVVTIGYSPTNEYRKEQNVPLLFFGLPIILTVLSVFWKYKFIV